MTEDLPRTPEGDLIRRARERAAPKLSIRAAAARIGISPEHWGNIERGHKSAGEGKTPRPLDEVSAALIAKMARAVGLTPEQVENEGRRPDAAEALRELLSSPAAPDAEVIPFPSPPDDFIKDLADARLADIEASLGSPVDRGDRVERAIAAQTAKDPALIAAEIAALREHRRSRDQRQGGAGAG